MRRAEHGGAAQRIVGAGKNQVPGALGPLVHAVSGQGDMRDGAGRAQIAAGQRRHDAPPIRLQGLSEAQRGKAELVGPVRFAIQIGRDAADRFGAMSCRLRQSCLGSL